MSCRDSSLELLKEIPMPRSTPRPAAFLIEADHQPPCVMLDHAKAVEHAAWKHGRVEGLVRESLYVEAVEKIRELTDKLAARQPENEGI